MKKKKQKQTNKFHEVFSPTILETQVPNRFVDIINATGDDVLSSEQKSAKWDWSHKLVGKVSKEIQIPVDNADDRAFLFKTMKQGCLNYINYIISKNRAYGWYKLAGRDGKPTIDNIHLTHSWIVSQYAGEYNPYHHHTGDFSAVVYLKIPPNMEEELNVEFTDHYPTNGLIEFMYGENCDMRSDTIKFKPEVGTMLVFPSYLKHFVYPFYSEGERRSMSFNAHFKV
jgi:hypothetical protein|tara:strand:+ start:1934 stop:2614 length:681 start_codon:yes stop_codon:yes gene_type:complete